MLGSVYLGALRAGEEMARFLGDEDKAREYRRVFESGKARTERELWNGEWFVQNVAVSEGVAVPKQLVTPGTEEAPYPKDQYGFGAVTLKTFGFAKAPHTFAAAKTLKAGERCSTRD